MVSPNGSSFGANASGGQRDIGAWILIASIRFRMERSRIRMMKKNKPSL
jgi:hypothetical protein